MNKKIVKNHIDYIEKCFAEYFRTLDKTLGNKILNLLEQLDYYERLEKYGKPNEYLRLYVRAT